MRLFIKYLCYILSAVCLCSCTHSDIQPGTLQSDNDTNRTINKNLLLEAIKTGQINIVKNRIDNYYWNMPSYLGDIYISQYYLALAWLDEKNDMFDTDKYSNMLIQSQLEDGSWHQLVDKNRTTGDINTTIYNYWVLKVIDHSIASDALLKAKQYILNHGGLQKASLNTKIFLSLFGNYDWGEIPYIPSIVLTNNSHFGIQAFGQWVAPHMRPIVYLKKNKAQKILGTPYDLSELYLRHKKVKHHSKTNKHSGIIKDLINGQQVSGSWGGYTSATLLTAMALKHHVSIDKTNENMINKKVSKGLKFIEQLYLNSGTSSYKGAVFDGRFWDTALLTYSLMLSGHSQEDLNISTDFLAKQQHKNGGFPFGLDYWEFPDNDDTAIISTLLNKIGGYDSQVSKSNHFLISMQNNDGGWGAFDKNNNGNFLLKCFAAPILDSIDLFDDSSPDLTGHVLEALGTAGYSNKDKFISNAVKYLMKQQAKSSHLWRGRWGVNYIYGTSAVISGLMSVNVNPDEPFIKNAIHRLIELQNDDGGFGESTLSYSDEKWIGKGKSTPTQTAWALSALIDSGYGNTNSAKDAVSYLINQINADSKWVDTSVVGTGHPNNVYIEYPSYSYAFPLIALSKYYNALDN